MDVGNPSNFYRLDDIYGHHVDQMRTEIVGYAYDDDQTKKAILELQQKYNYIIDPHGAVGYLALKEYLRNTDSRSINGVVLGTAHPAKFLDTVEEVIGEKVRVPKRLATYADRTKQSVMMNPDFKTFKAFLMATYM